MLAQFDLVFERLFLKGLLVVREPCFKRCVCQSHDEFIMWDNGLAIILIVFCMSNIEMLSNPAALLG